MHLWVNRCLLKSWHQGDIFIDIKTLLARDYLWRCLFFFVFTNICPKEICMTSTSNCHNLTSWPVIWGHNPLYTPFTFAFSWRLVKLTFTVVFTLDSGLSGERFKMRSLVDNHISNRCDLCGPLSIFIIDNRRTVSQTINLELLAVADKSRKSRGLKSPGLLYL